MRSDDPKRVRRSWEAVKPGHLLIPFGWSADALAAIIMAEPELLPHLFELDSRVHGSSNRVGVRAFK